MGYKHRSMTSDEASQRLPRDPTVGVLVFGYGAFYLCRANLGASLPLLRTAFHTDEAELGVLTGGATAAYALGKFFLGPLSDRFGGRAGILVALFGSVFATTLAGAATTLVWFGVFAGASRFFQAGAWSGVVQIASERFPPERHGTIMGIVSVSYEVGNILALLLSSWLAARWGYRALFLVNPALLLLVGGALWLLLPKRKASPRKVGGPPTKAPLWALFQRPSLFLVMLLSVLLTFSRITFLDWTPMFLTHAAGGGEAVAIVRSALFPLAGIASAVVTGILADRFDRALVCASMLSPLFVVLLLLAQGVGHGVLLATILVGCSGLFLLGPYSLASGAFALDIAGGRGAGAAAGLIDGAGYVGATLAGFVIGPVAKHYGWSFAFRIVAAAALLSALLMWGWMAASRLRSKRVG